MSRSLYQNFVGLQRRATQPKGEQQSHRSSGDAVRLEPEYVEKVASALDYLSEVGLPGTAAITAEPAEKLAGLKARLAARLQRKAAMPKLQPRLREKLADRRQAATPDVGDDTTGEHDSRLTGILERVQSLYDQYAVGDDEYTVASDEPPPEAATQMTSGEYAGEDESGYIYPDDAHAYSDPALEEEINQVSEPEGADGAHGADSATGDAETDTRRGADSQMAALLRARLSEKGSS